MSDETVNEEEVRWLKTKSALLTAISDVALGKAGKVETYQAVTEAWRDGILTDTEANGLGKALLALERQG